MITIKIEGLRELNEKLRQMGPKINQNGLRAANYAGAKTIINAVKATAPVRTGLLKANLVIFRRRGPEGLVKHSVGVKGVRLKYANNALNRRLNRSGKKYQADGPAFYAKFLEYGSSRMHAQSFMRPAFLNTAEDAVYAVRDRMKVAVTDAAK